MNPSCKQKPRGVVWGAMCPGWEFSITDGYRQNATSE